MLCVVCTRKVHHFEIFFRPFDKKYCTSNGLKFSSLEVPPTFLLTCTSSAAENLSLNCAALASMVLPLVV